MSFECLLQALHSKLLKVWFEYFGMKCHCHVSPHIQRIAILRYSFRLKIYQKLQHINNISKTCEDFTLFQGEIRDKTDNKIHAQKQKEWIIKTKNKKRTSISYSFFFFFSFILQFCISPSFILKLSNINWFS